VPESFRVLVKELQSLSLDIRVLDKDGNEVVLRDTEDDEPFGRGGAQEEQYATDAEMEAAGFLIADADESEFDYSDLSAATDEELEETDEDDVDNGEDE
jgi:DNA-directed RNA polymerase subunit beta